MASRLAPEKGVEVAVEACAAAGVPLVVAGDGPRGRGAARAGGARGGEVRFAGRLDAPGAGASCARGAALAVVPSRSAETFGLAAAEAMADGVPVVASRIGALPELVEADGLVAAGDRRALAGRDPSAASATPPPASAASPAPASSPGRTPPRPRLRAAYDAGAARGP